MRFPSATRLVIASEDRHSGKRLLDVLGKRLRWFRYQVTRIWQKWLTHRSRLKRLNWDRMNELLTRYPLPPVTITHSWQSTLSEPAR